MTAVPGTNDLYDVERADQPFEPGTLLSREFLTGALVKYEIFRRTTAGTVTWNPATYGLVNGDKIKVVMVGGGGGGGRSDWGGGGGAGGEIIYFEVTINQVSYNLVIGIGGTGGINGYGNNGGTTSGFGKTARFGFGGLAGNMGAVGGSGVMGAGSGITSSLSSVFNPSAISRTATEWTPNVWGLDTVMCNPITGEVYSGGGATHAYAGGGPPTLLGGEAAQNGRGPGAGGGGQIIPTGTAGGNGAPGAIMIYA